jgi:putative transcriptional regulator
VTNPASGHPPDRALDALLAGYASGTLSAPLHALVAGHLALAPRSRAFVRSLEATSGRNLDAIDPVPVTGRDEKLNAIFATSQEPDPPRVADAPAAGSVLPSPVIRYIGRDLPEIRWKTLLPGVKEYKIEESERGEAVLYWIKRGRKMPSHTHDGSEFTLVLQGAFRDENGHYRRGDIAIADQEVDHRPVADPDGDCICFAVTDAPLRLTGPVGRIIQRFLDSRS